MHNEMISFIKRVSGFIQCEQGSDSSFKADEAYSRETAGENDSRGAVSPSYSFPSFPLI